MSTFDFILNPELSKEAQVKHDQSSEQLRRGNIKRASMLRVNIRISPWAILFLEDFNFE
jgi:hypothetical protein